MYRIDSVDLRVILRVIARCLYTSSRRAKRRSAGSSIFPNRGPADFFSMYPGSMRRRRKRVRRNPSDPNVTYWLVLGGIVVGGVAIWAWKNMSDRDRAKALPGG